MPCAAGAGLPLERKRLPSDPGLRVPHCCAINTLCLWAAGGGGIVQGPPRLESPATKLSSRTSRPLAPQLPTQDPVPSAPSTLRGPGGGGASQSSRELGCPGCVGGGRPARRDPVVWMQLGKTSPKPEAAAAQHRSAPHTHQGDNSVISRPAFPAPARAGGGVISPRRGSPRCCLFNPFFKMTLRAVGWRVCARMPKFPHAGAGAAAAGVLGPPGRL